MNPGFTCTRLGYANVTFTAASIKQVYRHMSDWGGELGRKDHMWSTVPDDGEPYYTVHNPSFWTLGGD